MQISENEKEARYSGQLFNQSTSTNANQQKGEGSPVLRPVVQPIDIGK